MSVIVDITKETVQKVAGTPRVNIDHVKGKVFVNRDFFLFDLTRHHVFFGLKISYRPRRRKKSIPEFFQARFDQNDYRNRKMIYWIGNHAEELFEMIN